MRLPLLLRSSGLISKLVVLNALLLPGAFLGEQFVGVNQAQAQELPGDDLVRPPIVGGREIPEGCNLVQGNLKDYLESGEEGYDELDYMPPRLECTTLPPIEEVPEIPEIPEIPKKEVECEDGDPDCQDPPPPADPDDPEEVACVGWKLLPQTRRRAFDLLRLAAAQSRCARSRYGPLQQSAGRHPV